MLHKEVFHIDNDSNTDSDPEFENLIKASKSGSRSVMSVAERINTERSNLLKLVKNMTYKEFIEWFEVVNQYYISHGDEPKKDSTNPLDILLAKQIKEVRADYKKNILPVVYEQSLSGIRGWRWYDTDMTNNERMLEMYIKYKSKRRHPPLYKSTKDEEIMIYYWLIDLLHRNALYKTNAEDVKILKELSKYESLRIRYTSFKKNISLLKGVYLGTIDRKIHDNIISDVVKSIMKASKMGVISDSLRKYMEPELSELLV